MDNNIRWTLDYRAHYTVQGITGFRKETKLGCGVDMVKKPRDKRQTILDVLESSFIDN